MALLPYQLRVGDFQLTGNQWDEAPTDAQTCAFSRLNVSVPQSLVFDLTYPRVTIKPTKA